MNTTDYTNIDDQELAKFTNENVQWWDSQGPMKLLHTLNPLRLKYVLSHTPIKAKKIADIGCGGGIFAEALAKQHGFVTAIDMNESAIQAAQEHALTQGLQINYQHTTVEALANQSTEQFDVVTCMEMLEHVPDPQAIVEACAKATKPGGWLFFSTLNRTVKSFLGAIVAAEYLLQLLPKGTHEYRKFIRPSELHQWARRSSLQLEHLQGIKAHPLTRTMSFCDTIDINYIACYQKPLNYETN